MNKQIKTEKIVKNNKGITLVALTITIVIILILAGISINTLSGDNSLIHKSIQAKEMTNISELKTRAESAYSEALAKSNTEVSQELFQEKLDNEFNGSETATVESSEDGKRWIVKVNGVTVYSVEKEMNTEE